MRRGRYQREVIERLTRIEHSLKLVHLELAERASRQNRIDQDTVQVDATDKWLQDGISNIMAFQVGKKREGDQ